MIEIKNLHKSFNGEPVLKGVNLDIPKGAITVILGESGVGKSVLLKNIIGLMHPDAGRIIIDGTDIHKLNHRELNLFRRKFGMLFQSAALFDSLTVEGNIAFPLREHTNKTSHEIQRIISEKLALVGLEGTEKKYPAELSGGMRKRVGLARAIALEPEIILYDEPTTGLDPVTRDVINELIVAMQKKLNVTSVIISHDIESTFRVANKVAMLHDGRIAEEGTPENFRNSTEKVVRRFLRGA